MSNDLEFKTVNDHEWSVFQSGRGSFYQSVERMKAWQEIGRDTFLLGVYQNNELKIGAVITAKNGHFVIADGPVFDEYDRAVFDKFLSGVIEFTKSKKAIDLQIFPEILASTYLYEEIDEEKPNQAADIVKVFQDAGFVYFGRGRANNPKNKVVNPQNFVKDLLGITNDEELWATYNTTTRRYLRKTSANLYAEKADSDKIKEVASVIDESNLKNGVASPDPGFYQSLFTNFGEKIEFWTVKSKIDDAIVAGGIFIFDEKEVSYYSGGSSQKHLCLDGARFLQDFMLKRALELGYKRYNFLGFSTNNLLQFKNGFGGFIEEKIGGFEIVFQKGILHKIISRIKTRTQPAKNS